jgi:WD40 repeat protein
LLVSVGYRGNTKLWNVETGVMLQSLDVCCYGGFTSDGRYLVTVGRNDIRLWGIK